MAESNLTAAKTCAGGNYAGELGMPSFVTAGALVSGAIAIGKWLHDAIKSKPKAEVRAIWFGVKDMPSGIESFTSREAHAIERSDQGTIGVEVLNRGAVPLHIREVGFCRSRPGLISRFKRAREPLGSVAIRSVANGDISLPHKLEPGTSMTVQGSLEEMYSPDFDDVKLVYALTSDDRLFSGKCALLDAAVRHVRNLEALYK